MQKRWMAALAAPLAIAALLAGTAFADGAGGVSGPAFYVNGEMYRTVGTPTDFSETGAPGHSYDTIYEFHMAQPNVASGAPGDPGFHGGRWMVRDVIFTTTYAAAVAAGDMNGSGDLDSVAEIAAAQSAGALTIGGVLDQFECPVIPVPHHQT